MIRRLVVLVGLIVACTAAPAASPSASPSPSVAAASPTPIASPTPVPTPVPTSVLPASPTPIVLPNVAQISAPSGSVVWTLVAGTRLFRSTDRGDTWQERPLPAQPVNPLISFIDDHEGWLAQTGSPGPQCQSQSISISHTADGGTTWPSLPATGIATSQCKNGITFIDGTRGFVMANAPGGAPLVYRTANGGQTWAASGPLANPPGFVTSPGNGLVVTAIRSFGTAALAGVAGPNAQYVYGSPDGGSTWTYASTAPNQLDPIAFVTATRWLQIGAPGASKETTDAGATWHAFVTDYQQAAPVTPAITFGDAQVGYATVRGAIQRTIDGGAHWTAIRTPGTF